MHPSVVQIIEGRTEVSLSFTLLPRDLFKKSKQVYLFIRTSKP